MRALIKRLSPRERFHLTCFFKELVYDDGLGYTLFCGKPICLSGYIHNSDARKILLSPNGKNFNKGYAVWKKYEHYFPHPAFVFIDEPLQSSDLEAFAKQHQVSIEFRALYIINKLELTNSLKSHEALFVRELGEAFSAENLLARIEAREPFF